MYDDFIAQSSANWGIPIPWIEAIIQTESNWVATAINSGGDRGLMQISPPTAAAYGVTDLSTLFDPATNIDLGTHILADIRTQVGSDDLNAIYSMYNSGSANAYLTNSQVAANVSRFIANVTTYLQQNPIVATTGIGGGLIVILLIYLWTKSKRK